MDAVLRALAVYLFLLVLFRVSGKRTLAEITTFDFVLLLIIAETTQQALLGEDFSVTNSFLLITTLIGVDIALSVFKQRYPRLDNAIEGQPMILVEHGRPIPPSYRGTVSQVTTSCVRAERYGRELYLAA